MSNPFVNATLAQYNPTAYNQMIDERNLAQQQNYYSQIFNVPAGQMIDLSKVDPNSNLFYELMRVNQAISGNKSMMEQAQASMEKHQGDVFSEANLPNEYREYLRVVGPENATGEGFLQYQLEKKRAGANSTSVYVAAPAVPQGYYDPQKAQDLVDRDTGLPPTDLKIESVYNGIASGQLIPISEQERKGIQELNKAEAILDEIETNFGEIARNQIPGDDLQTKGKNWARNAILGVTKSDGGAVAAYKAQAEAFLGAIAKANEPGAGALSDGDVARMKQIIAQIGNINPADNDSVKSAQRKFDVLRNVFNAARATKGGRNKQKVEYIQLPGPNGRPVTRRRVTTFKSDGTKASKIDMTADYSIY